MYILLTGCTGVGKSTVGHYLSSQYDITYIDDPFVNNPFINTSFQRKDNMAFQSQLFFFKEFIKLHKRISNYHKSIIQERSIFESVEVFCRLFYETKIFSIDELRVFEDLLKELSFLFRKPNLIIYLKANSFEIRNRIRRRNRDFELNFNERLLDIQNTLYERWINKIQTEKLSKVITIDNTNLGIDQCNAFVKKEIDNILLSNRLQ